MQNNDINIPMLGSYAPRFVAESTSGPLKLTDYMGKWLILFSYPENFNPTCTSEIMAFSRLNNEFNKRNCNLLALSVDSNSSNMAWLNDMEDTMNVKIQFPIISDSDKRISQMYGMLNDKNNQNQTSRNVYFIDPDQKIRFILIYPIQNGRNTSELLRMLDALEFSDSEGVNTPINWIKGCSLTVSPTPQCYSDFKEQVKRSYNNLDLYIPFENTIRMRRW